MNNQKQKKFIFPPIIRGITVNDTNDLFPIGKIYCVGRNYLDHAKEMKESVDRDKPFFFSKPPQSMTQQENIPFPAQTNDLHHEVELVVFLKSRCEDIDPNQAAQHIFGYGVGVDLTKRDMQNLAKSNKKPWDLSKGFDNSAPISEIFHNEGEVIRSGSIKLKVNGIEKQSSDLSNMVWGVDELISWLSKFITLKPGDIIFTGTPAGVGSIKPGDKIEANIENVGELSFALT